VHDFATLWWWDTVARALIVICLIGLWNATAKPIYYLPKSVGEYVPCWYGNRFADNLTERTTKILSQIRNKTDSAMQFHNHALCGMGQHSTNVVHAFRQHKDKFSHISRVKTAYSYLMACRLLNPTPNTKGVRCCFLDISVTGFCCVQDVVYSTVWQFSVRGATGYYNWDWGRITNFMEQSPSWETNNPSASQIPRLLCNPKVHYRVHKCPQVVLSWSSRQNPRPCVTFCNKLLF
jgi:hypothetical protein